MVYTSMKNGVLEYWSVGVLEMTSFIKSHSDFILPRMGNGPCLTCLYTGKRRRVLGRFARAALIFELSSLVLSHHRHRLISQGIIGIFILHNKDVGRACGNTITATVAQVRVNGDVKFT
jgi:hypothetical protein